MPMHPAMQPPLSREDLIGRYNAHAREYYRRADGSPTRHAGNIELATRPLVSQLPAETFGLDDLREYRDSLIDRGLKRRTINQWVGWTRGMFRWAAREKLIPPALVAELSLLEPLRYGRSRAKEHNDGVIVTLAMVLRLLPELSSVVGSMLRIQWLTGMRPGEVVSMKWSELIDFDGCTVYRPTQHKTKHHNRSRVIVLVDEIMHLINSQEQRGDHVWNNTWGRPYNTHTYCMSVSRACKRLGITVWTPGRIRRSTATYARRITDTETVQRLLGHASPEMTEWYYDLDVIDAIQATERLNATPEWGKCRSQILGVLEHAAR
jgi:integrase